MLNLIAQAPANLGGFKAPTEAYSTGSDTEAGALSNLEKFVSNAIGVITIVATLFFIIYFIMGAFKWVAAGGDSGKVQKARDEMTQGVLGLILIVASYGLIGLVGRVVGLTILDPVTMIKEIIPTP